jgi:Rab3 GTPase-activating protein catalytic subunit
VRWYSPRDWLEEENKLSARMLIEGNTWQELWTAAKPVPAARQKRLFDDTREAEKVSLITIVKLQKKIIIFLMNE